MAGGKETPRQKMIGMMYLVLTALLALNVSKAILDAFVTIEENIQVTNENEFNRGDAKYLDLLEVANDDTEPEIQKKAKLLLKSVDQIDKLTAERIREIDELKFEVLAACGEDVKSIGTGNIVVEKFKDPLQPARLNLEFVNAQDKYDEPMSILIGEDIKRPTGKGLTLWNNYNKYRSEISKILVSSAFSDSKGKAYFFKDPKINSFNNSKEIDSRLNKAIAESHVNPEDTDVLKKIYTGLTKKEFHTVHEVENVHWIGKTFDHAPVVAAIASLSSLQKEILTARADAITVLRNRVTGGEYSFNAIMAIAHGPEVANRNEDVELEVMMVAYNSDKQPTVTYEGKTIENVKDGKGRISVKTGANEMNLKGEISITNKSGITKTLPWSKNIKVMQPMATVSIPGFNMLYRGYDNRIEAVASGFDKTVVLGNNVALTPDGKQHIARPGNGNTCSITVSGKNTASGKTVQLGTFNFRVSTLPPPSLNYGNYTDGSKISRSAIPSVTKIFAKYPPSIPLDAQFTIISYEVSVTGGPRPEPGTGSALTAKSIGLLKMAPKGSRVTITAYVKDPAGGKRYITSSFTID